MSLNFRGLSIGGVCVVSAAILTGACVSPAVPSTVSSSISTTAPKAGVPARVELTSTSGIGANGGHATIAVHVRDAFSAPVASVTVSLASSAGTLTPTQLVTDEAGLGAAVLDAPAGGAMITATIANGPSTSRLVAVQPLNVPPDPIPNPPPPPPPPIPTPTPSPKPAPPGPAPTPVPLFTRSGTGASVFDLPTSVSRVRITADYGGFCENFIVHIAGAGVVNDILGTCGTGSGPHFGGTFATSGGRVDVLNSTGINWMFTEVR